MKAFPSLAVLILLLPAAASAAGIGPIIDLPLAALVGAQDPGLTAESRHDLAVLADGGSVARQAPIEVKARAILCRESDVAIGKRSCKLTFAAGTVTLTGMKAHEMDATLKEAGVPSQGAAGTIYTGLADLRCSVSPLQVLAQAGGGAPCDFTTQK